MLSRIIQDSSKVLGWKRNLSLKIWTWKQGNKQEINRFNMMVSVERIWNTCQAPQIFTHHSNPSECSTQAMLHHRNQRNPKVLGRSSARLAMVPLVPARPSSQERPNVFCPGIRPDWGPLWVSPESGAGGGRGTWWEPTKNMERSNELQSQNFTIKNSATFCFVLHLPFVKSPGLLRKPLKRNDFRSTISDWTAWWR